MNGAQELIHILATGDPQKSAEAAETLIALGKAAVKPLAEGLAGASPKCQWKILNVLSKMRDVDAVPQVITCLDSENMAVRIAAVQCLQLIGDGAVVPRLLEMLSGPSEPGSKMWVIQALGAFHDPRVVDALLRAVRETESAVERYTAIEALGQIGDCCAIETIQSYLNDENHHVRAKARTALEALGVAFE